MSKARNVVLSLLTIVATLLFLEVTLSVLARLSTRVNGLLAPPTVAIAVPDDRFGYRPNPDYPGHDANGFRNPTVPERADIVVLGDSQTYGFGVRAADAWPRQLEEMTSRTVYSMAYGGFGPAHSLGLFDEVLALNPSVIIEAFYAGNDLFDAFNLVHGRGQLLELASQDDSLLNAVRELEQSDPIEERVMAILYAGQSKRPRETPTTAFGITSLWHLVSQKSKLCALIRRICHEVKNALSFRNQSSTFVEKNAAYCEAFDDGRFKTVFTPGYRLLALDLDDARIVEGLHISLEAIRRMGELANGAHARFIVVLIPTKETVFRDLRRETSSDYLAMTENEERMWRITKQFLDDNEIEYLDALRPLREQLEAGVQPYKTSYDGHPNAHGHKAIAALIAKQL